MGKPKTLIGILALFLLHLIWLGIPMLYGFQWMSLSPLILVLSSFMVGLFHRDWEKRFAIFAALVFGFGFILSAIGNHTGALFGQYFYGQHLGVMIWDTPLTIGLLWLLVCYSASVVIANGVSHSSVFNRTWIKVLLASLIVLVMDILLEQTASILDFWYHKNQSAPIQNYTAWFAFAAAFNYLFVKMEVNTQNPIAKWFLVFFIGFLFALTLLPAYTFAQ
jgi:bisanhydrobacterioruberin hydratase